MPIDIATISNGLLVVLASLGLSLSAGVRAYLPVLAVGLSADISQAAGGFFGYHVNLLPQFSWVGNPLFLGVLAVLTLYEISADKIPVVDHLNDTVHTIIRPLSGALIFVSTDNALTSHGPVGMAAAAIIGGSLAATTHIAKAGVVRPASTVTTFGLANPIISLGEDILVIFTTLISLLVPLLGGILFVILGFFVVRGLGTLVRNRRAKRLASAYATSHP